MEGIETLQNIIKSPEPEPEPEPEPKTETKLEVEKTENMPLGEVYIGENFIAKRVDTVSVKEFFDEKSTLSINRQEEKKGILFRTTSNNFYGIFQDESGAIILFDSRKNEFLNVDQNFLKDLDPKISLGKEAFFRCNNKDYVKKTTGVMEIIVYREEKNTISDMVERFKELSQKNKEQKVE